MADGHGSGTSPLSAAMAVSRPRTAAGSPGETAWDVYLAVLVVLLMLRLRVRSGTVLRGLAVTEVLLPGMLPVAARTALTSTPPPWHVPPLTMRRTR